MIFIIGEKFQHWNNRIVGCYGLAMFFFGFVLMAAEGSGLAALELVDVNDIYQACHGGEKARKKIYDENALGWLIVPFAKKAKKFDDYQDNILDKVMCSDTCPCFRNENGTAYNMYSKLPDKYLKQFDRIFDVVHGGLPSHPSHNPLPNHLHSNNIGSHIDKNARKPLVWSTDRNRSFESFIECFISWMHKAQNSQPLIGPKIKIGEMFNLPEFEGEEEGLTDLEKYGKVMLDIQSVL